MSKQSEQILRSSFLGALNDDVTLSMSLIFGRYHIVVKETIFNNNNANIFVLLL
jgi:hypothetical protein